MSAAKYCPRVGDLNEKYEVDFVSNEDTLARDSATTKTPIISENGNRGSCALQIDDYTHHRTGAGSRHRVKLRSGGAPGRSELFLSAPQARKFRRLHVTAAVTCNG